MNSGENKINKKSNIVIIVILIGICFFHIISNYLWIKEDVLSWYPEKYYLLIHKNIIFFSLREIIHGNLSFLDKFISAAKLIRSNISWGWGVIFYIYTAYINLVFGNTTNVSLMTNIPAFILLIIFIFLIGKEIAGRKAGLLAAFLISFYPGIYGMSRSYGVDFPLITMVTISAYILVTKDITKIRYSLLFGLIMGLTLLIKGTGAYFLIGPLVYIFYQHIYKIIRSRQRDNFRQILRIFLSFTLFIILILSFLSLMWGPMRIKYLFSRYIYHLVFFPLFVHRRHFYWVCPYNAFDIRSIFFYIFEMMYSMSKLLFLFFCIGSLLFWKNRLRYKMIIYFWILVPYIIFTLSINKAGRYYFPVLPALALVTATGILQIKLRKCKIILVTAIGSLSLLQFYDLSFGTTFLPQSLYKHPDYSFVAYLPQKCEEDKVITHFLETINKEKKEPDYRPKILFVAPHGVIDYGKLEYIFQTKEANVEFAKFFSAASDYQDCDYIIVLNDKISDDYKPDLSFLKIPEYYRDFLKISYRQYLLSNAKLEEMYNTFVKFKVVDYYATNNFFFHLCKNTKGQDRERRQPSIRKRN